MPPGKSPARLLVRKERSTQSSEDAVCAVVLMWSYNSSQHLQDLAGKSSIGLLAGYWFQS